MKYLKIFLICVIFSLLITGCKKQDNKPVTTIQIKQLTDEELAKKYGSKDLTKEQINKIISSIKWTTNTNYETLGSKDAKKGGTFTEGRSDYPATLRIIGENTANSFNSTLESLVYESLMGLHPITLDYTPGIADKWYIDNDKKTYYFHIDPKAIWQDNLPITAYDFVATWDLNVSDGIKDPFNQDFWNNYERPVALSKEVIMVKAKNVEWNRFLYVSTSLSIMPEHIIGRITPEEYMKEFQNKMTIGSGPYMLDEVKTNQMIILKRNKNWWGLSDPSNLGSFNFDNIKFIFSTDDNILEEKFKKGETDYLYLRMQQINKWVNNFTPEKMDTIKYNNIVKQKIYTNTPIGIVGYMFNTREEPFNDIRVRKAFTMLLDREKIVNKLFYGDFKLMDSYFPNSPYENPDNPKAVYNPEKAVELLEQAGYSQKNINKDGYMVKNGKVFELNLNIYSDDSRVETIFQEDLKKIGIKLNINRVTWAKHIKDLDDRNFKITPLGYTGLMFPNPISSFHSSLADKKSTNNIWGLKNKRVDEICELNNKEFDLQKRIKLIQELDKILTNEYLLTFRWFNSNTKIMYWNKFGTPEFVLSRFGNDPVQSILYYWWYDEKSGKALENAKGRKIMLPAKAPEVKYWDKYKRNY